VARRPPARRVTTKNMTMREWCLCALLFLAAPAVPAGTGEWKNYTSMKNVRGVARDGNRFWAATSGGMFAWSPSDNSDQLFTNAEGLLSTDLTAIAVDSAGNVWIGTSTGIIHLYSPSTGSLRTILDIANTNQTNKAINAFSMNGDTVLICTEFGLSVFRISSFEFGDTYTKFGTSGSSVRYDVLSATIFANKIWACITDGQTVHRIAVGDLSKPNLLPPESWELQTVGSPGTTAQTVTSFSGTLYSGTSTGLYSLQGSNWIQMTALGTQSVIGTAASSNLLALTTGTQTYTLTAQGTLTPFGTALPSTAQCLTTAPDGKPVVGSATAGILTWSATWTSHMPNGPNSNQFVNVTVDPTGAVWGASGTNGLGFYRLRNGLWKSYTTTNSPLLNNDFYRTSVTSDGAVWITSFGRGLVELPPGTDAVDSTRLYWTNVGMVGLPNDPNYVVPSNVVGDSHGNTWTTIISPADRNVIAVRRANGSWLTLPALVNGVQVSTLTDVVVDKALAVDASDNLWAIVRDPSFKGVVSFRNAGTTDLSRSLQIVAADGLPSDDIRTIVVDRENDLWIGTDKGISIILDPANPKRDGGIAKYKPLLGLVINCIAVDPLNRKWVGTNQGAILLSPDGTQLLTSLTVENTEGKIINNDISSIAIDDQAGTVYFGTPLGLASLTTSAAAPTTSFEELKIFPNPYRLPTQTPLTVDGLMANSSIKILTSDGKLVRDIKSPGGRVGFWDGRDEQGLDVASGIYLIIAYTEDGQVANGKVAVLKK
jgi:ligand-binding sensor domain-containing protein